MRLLVCGQTQVPSILIEHGSFQVYTKYWNVGRASAVKGLLEKRMEIPAYNRDLEEASSDSVGYIRRTPIIA